MKFEFKRSVLVRVAALLLAATAPVLSGCDDDDTTEELKRQIEETKRTDDELIRGYLTRNNITQFTRLDSTDNAGIYIVNITDGSSTNPRIKTGQQVEVKYVGRFLRESGAQSQDVIFDNSSDSRVPCGCINFTVGAGQVIKGWEAVALKMRKGDRKMVLIPSYLAYGTQGTSGNVTRPGIPPNEPLRFDMEILDVR